VVIVAQLAKKCPEIQTTPNADLIENPETYPVVTLCVNKNKMIDTEIEAKL